MPMWMSIGLIPSLVLYTLTATCLVYALVIADPSTSLIAHLLTIKLPLYIESVLLRLFGKRSVVLLRSSFRHFLTVFYLTVVLGSWSVMLTYGYSWISSSTHVSDVHKQIGYFVFLACMYSYQKVRRTSPGYITPSTLSRYESTYPYDDLLFPPNRICPTVGIPRLPRSKYDRVSKRHVARFDHYCGWVENAVGEENYRHFLFFLAVHVGMCGYGTAVTWWLFRGEVEEMDLLNAVYVDAATGIEHRASLWVVGNYMFRRRFAMASVMILMGAMTACLGMFLMFHLYICGRGMTTNEYYKWKEVGRWWKCERRKFERARSEGTPVVARGGDERSAKPYEKDVDVGCVGPIGTAEIAVTNVATDIGEAPEDPGPFPPNVYDRGIIENYGEVLFPRSRRKEAEERWALANRERKKKEREGVVERGRKNGNNSQDKSVEGVERMTKRNGKAKAV